MKILLIEDRVGDVLLKVLGKWGYEVLLAEDGESAWEVLTETRIEFFLIDWMLPGISGLELVHRIRELEQYRDVPIVMISSRTRKEDLAKVAQAGVDGYIAKPFTPVQLRGKIEEVFRKWQQDPALDTQAQQIVKGHRAFDPDAAPPLVVMGVGATNEEGLLAGGRCQINGLSRMVKVMEEVNAEDADLQLGHILVESTNEIALLLARWSMRVRMKMIVLTPQCKGNYMLLLRLLKQGDVEAIPFVLMCARADDLTPEVRKAVREGSIYLFEDPTADDERWQELADRYLVAGD